MLQVLRRTALGEHLERTEVQPVRRASHQEALHLDPLARVAGDEAGAVRSPLFSPDGKILVYHSDATVSLLDLESGNDASFATEAANVIMLPDGSVPRIEGDWIQVIGLDGSLRAGFARGAAGMFHVIGWCTVTSFVPSGKVMPWLTHLPSKYTLAWVVTDTPSIFSVVMKRVLGRGGRPPWTRAVATKGRF